MLKEKRESRYSKSHLSIGQLLPVGRQVEQNARAGAGQSDAAKEENDQHEIGEQSREVDYLAGRLYALAEAEKYNYPGD